ncbi:sigma-70 family RNA polymerase sigma factor [Blastomonas aquatica]|uniref:DNA-directed RNA polymerase sigma-70 factor n=1 Tax=Blastomonas aquatica TaxID=1510276 RepID=A0ABQ1JPB4_9SPHN|nr:sigma-70 family RNA polymerase sigma factor [Blastomonas aquatica]GGB72152.1 DNA-directed RNA polymerase sigma-70 factor [Blastomonas aquatica]
MTTNQDQTTQHEAVEVEATVPEVIVPLDDATFKQRLAATIPHLRAFGYSLCGKMDLADDLVQDTMLKAWAARARFRPDTSMRAWTFVILRNCYISQMRRNKFTAPYDEGVAERTLTSNSDQQAPLHLEDVRMALMQLGEDQREAIILVGAGGFSYEEAAEICDCAVGTMKSRVSRARAALLAMLDGDSPIGTRRQRNSADEAMSDILGTLDRLSEGVTALAA